MVGFKVCQLTITAVFVLYSPGHFPVHRLVPNLGSFPHTSPLTGAALFSITFVDAHDWDCEEEND